MANLFVQDTTARANQAPRVHEFLRDDGSDERDVYSFVHGEKKQMPAAEAAKFLKHDHFVVTDEKGFVIKPLPKERGGETKLTLSDDEVIAHWDELQISALVKRANAITGGASANNGWGKAKLIKFLKSARAEAEEEASKTDGSGTDADDAGDAEDMSEDEVKALFGDEDT